MASVYVELDMSDFSDKEVKDEYEHRFKKKPNPQLYWRHDQGDLVLSFGGIDAGLVREAIEMNDAYRLLDVIRRNYVEEGRLAA